MIDFLKLEAVLWDMDGVLVDSSVSHFEGWRQVLGKYAIEYNEERLRRTFGMTNNQVIKTLSGKLLAEELVEQIASEKDARFQAIISVKAVFLPGVQHWLEVFHQNGVKQALASSGSPGNIHTVLRALDAEDYFDIVVSGDGMPSKPDPYVFVTAAERMGVFPRNCLVIEDAIAGVRAAKTAGMKCIAVTTSSAADKLEDADLVLDNLAELAVRQVRELFEV